MKIEFLDGIAVLPKIRLTLKLRTDAEWHVKHRVRQVEKEWSILITLDKGNRFVRIASRKFRRIRRSLHDLIAGTRVVDGSPVRAE